MRTIRRYLTVVLFALAIAPPSSASGQVPGGELARRITPIREPLFTAQFDDRSTVVFVTSEGLAIGDPLGREAAAWLKQELASRFPGLPVKYVLQTSHDFERAEGAALFKPSAKVIGHRGFNEALDRDRRKLPSELAALDRNANGSLDAREMAGSTAGLILRDDNGDGEVTADELYRHVEHVDSGYASRLTGKLGGKLFELVHAASSDHDDSSVIYFPAEKVVFSADTPLLKRSPGSQRGLPDAAEWAHAIIALDFQTLLTGRGERLSRADVEAFGRYVDDLSDAVRTGFKDGLSVSALQAAIDLPAYRGAAYYADRPAAIAAVYDRLHLLDVGLSATGMVSKSFGTSTYCDGYATCHTEGPLSGGTGAVAIAFDRYAFVAEFTLSNQFLASRTSPLYDEEFAHRDTRTSFLFRYRLSSGARLSLDLLGGLTATSGDTKGLSLVKEGLPPFAGRRPLTGRSTSAGLAGGVDIGIPMSGPFVIVVPLRMAQTPGAPTTAWSSHVTFSVGAGIGIHVLRRVQ